MKPAATATSGLATTPRRRAGSRCPRSRPDPCSRALIGAPEREIRLRNSSRETSAASGPMWEKSGSRSARPRRRLSFSASRPPSANSSAKRSQRSGGSSIAIRPAMPEVQSQRRPVGLRPEELAAPVRGDEPVTDQGRAELARPVRPGDVGVGVVDRDDLAPQRTLDRLSRALGLRQFGHTQEATMRRHAVETNVPRRPRIERALPREGAAARGRRGIPRPRGRRRPEREGRRSRARNRGAQLARRSRARSWCA